MFDGFLQSLRLRGCNVIIPILLESIDERLSIIFLWSSSRSRVPIGISILAIDAACAFRAEEMPSLISWLMVAKDNIVEEEDGEWIYFSGGNSSSETKKYQGSNSSDGGNTRDGVKIAGGVIGSSDR
ncbi:hypothetical protein Tco_0741452 [Tanacetum coccineum]